MDDMDRETEIEWHRRKYSGHIHRADDPGYYHHRHCRPAELTTTIPEETT